MEKKLEQLLLGKTFQQLTAEEKYYVTESIGEAEYDRLHFILNKSKTALKYAPPINPAIKNNLLLAMRQRKTGPAIKKPLAIVRIMQHRLPAWQAAAAVALLLGFQFMMQEKPQNIVKTETVYVHSTDTIYKEVAMPTDVEKPAGTPPVRVNVKPKAQDLQLEKEPAIIAAVDGVARRYEESQVPDTFNVLVSQPRGQSATETADLWKLLGEVY